MNNGIKISSVLLAGLLIIFSFTMVTVPVLAQSASAICDTDKQILKSGESTNITITISNNIGQALSLDVDIPAGWNLTRVSDDADKFKPSTNEWVWFSVGAGETKTVIYNLEVPSDATAGDYPISGKISNASGVIGSVKDENKVTVERVASLPPSPTPAPTPTPPGFEAVFAIAGLLAVAYLVLSRKKQ